MTSPATASSLPAAPASSCSRSSSTPRLAAPRIYGELVGYGATSDGYDMVQPSGEGAARCMRLAMQGVDGKSITSTRTPPRRPIGDVKEIEAIREVFGDKSPPISATKSLTGHSLGAAGRARGDLFAADDE